MFFENRSEAGEKLAARLLDEPWLQHANKDDLLVLSIPRGGVVVGAAVAQVLGCAHNVIVVKKIGFPGHEELAIGAVAEDGLVILNEELSRWSPVEEDYITQEIARIKAQVVDYIRRFRQGKALDLQSRIVIVVDDGIATGETMKAAVKWLMSRDDPYGPKKVLVAVPVCSPRAADELEKLVDKFVCLSAPEHFWAVGQFYREFWQVNDEEVVRYLRAQQATEHRAA